MVQYSQLDSPISPQSFLCIIRRRRKLVLFSFLTIISLVAAVTFLMPPAFEASARILVSYQDDYEKVSAPAQFRVPYNIIATELAIFKTRAIIEPVVSTLGLDKIDKNPDQTDPKLRHQKAVARLAADLSVEREKDTAILAISYADRDPQRAADVVNESVRQYMKQRPTISKDESAVRFLSEQINEIEHRIDSLEIKSQAYKSRTKVLMPEKQSQILFTTLAEFDREITSVRRERIAKEARLRVIKGQLAEGDDISIPSTESSNSMSKMDYLNELRKTALNLQLRQNALAQKYTKKHPQMIAVTQDINNTRAKIDKEIKEIVQLEETEIKAVRAQERELSRARSQVARSIADLSRKEYELGKHTLSLDELKKVHAALIEQRERAYSASRKKQHIVQARVLDAAVVPFRPARPNKRLYLALGFVLSLLFSITAAFIVEYFDHAVHTAEDAQYCLGLPILATIQDVHPRHMALEKDNENRIVFKSLD